MNRIIKLLITCEHADNHIPEPYSGIFNGYENLLQSHRGLDIGALELAGFLSEELNVDLLANKTTRLLVDVNRSLYRRTLFSEVTKSLSKDEKEFILAQYYYPYRKRIEQTILSYVQQKFFLLHISIHSFAPVLDGKIRNTDIGILYNPVRFSEKALAKIWRSQILSQNNTINVRYNYPFLGKPDGLPAFFRKKYSDEQYAGFEFEVNQKYPIGNSAEWQGFKTVMADALEKTIQKFSEVLSS